MKIRKDDNVLVIAGKDRGKKGKVRFAFPDDKRLIIEGVNLIKKHAKAIRDVRQAGIIEREAPVDSSNVMLLCNKCSKPTRVGVQILQDGTRARVCRVCREVID
jgi:large subunit ribosomal protein L24